MFWVIDYDKCVKYPFSDYTSAHRWLCYVRDIKCHESAISYLGLDD